MSASQFLPWLAEALIASALLMALVMLLRRPVAHAFGMRAAYALWALPVLRLLLPPLPAGTRPTEILHAQTGGFSIDYVRDAVAAPAAAFPWVEAALLLWGVGAVGFLVWNAFAYVRFRRLMLSDGTIVGREGRITILESVHATGPLAFGIFHKHIVLPIDFADRYTPSEQALALAHEHMHHERRDLAANLGAALLLTLHWCNPLAWIAYRAFRADQELACDAQVLARHGADQTPIYARAILKAATAARIGRTGSLSTCHLNNVDTLKGRLKMLSNHPESLRRISWGMSAVAIVTVAGLALTASGSQAAQEMAGVSQRLGDARLTKLAAFLPQAPDMPESPEPPLWPEASAIPETPQAPPAIEATEAPAVPTPPAVPTTMRRVKITTQDGNTFYQNIAAPTQAEIAALAPDVRVDHRCDGDAMVSTRNYDDAAGERHVRVSVCQRAIQRKAMVEAQAGMAQAKTAVAQARVESERARAEAQAEDKATRAQAWAENARARAEAQAEDKADRAQARAEAERARAEIRREMMEQKTPSH